MTEYVLSSLIPTTIAQTLGHVNNIECKVNLFSKYGYSPVPITRHGSIIWNRFFY